MDALGTRLFVVCGRAVEAEVLQEAFQPYGNVVNVKLIKEKGVAYVTFDRASSAALAIEQLNGAVLNAGRGPKLKVMLAEAPSARGMPVQHAQEQADVSADPDNMPPRSRLFLVVPKLADTQQIQGYMSKYPGLEYCKVDLVANKGVCFCKFYRASAALVALEDINATGMVAGYKVKCMLAEPKTKRKPEGGFQDVFGGPQGKLDYGMGGGGPGGAGVPMGAGLPGHMGVPSGYGMGALPGLPSGLGFPLAGGGGGGKLGDNLPGLGPQVGLGFVGGLGNLQGGPEIPGAGNPNSAVGGSSLPLSKQRLYVVVHKGVSEDMLARLFKRLPGMEYCDLKKDYATGKSKGFCYVNYSTPEAAAAAIEHYNGIEFPPHSGHRIKVLYAEPLGVRPPAGNAGGAPGMAVGPGATGPGTGIPSPVAVGGVCASPGSMNTTPSVGHAPLSHNISPDIVSITDSLGSMAMPSTSQLEPVDRAVLLASPVSSTGGGLNNLAHASPAPARKLMFP